MNTARDERPRASGKRHSQASLGSGAAWREGQPLSSRNLESIYVTEGILRKHFKCSTKAVVDYWELEDVLPLR